MRGFTLIELLAVIVILAIILIVAIPIINNLIEDVRINAFESTAKNLADAAELEYSKNIVDSNYEQKIIIFENGVSIADSLSFTGEIPKNGMIVIGSDGKIAMALHNDKYCLTRDKNGEYLISEIPYDECLVPGINLPEAIVTTSPSGDLYPNTPVTFLSTSSIAKDGKTIVDSEWQNVTTNYAVGNHVIKLRVKDSDGFWSPWTETTINVISPPAITKIATSGYHTLVLLSDKTVMSFGSNNNGQLGNGTTGGSTLRPTRIPGLTNIKDILAYGSSSFVITESNTVYSWGNNSYGILGHGNTTATPTPTLISGLTNVKQLSVSDFFTIAVLHDGSVRSWGRNHLSQLGIGGTTDQYSPVNVTAVTGVTQVANGNGFAMVRRSDGTLRSWGYNAAGSLGNNSTTNSSTPVTPSGVTGSLQITSTNGQTFSLTGGTIKAWGHNGNGQLATGDTSIRTVPTIINGIPTSITKVFTSTSSAYALLSTGEVYAWGGNTTNNILGFSTQGNILTPQLANLMTNVEDISASSLNIFIKTKDGKYYSWGNNSHGQLGNGNTVAQTAPIEFNIW